MQTTHIGKEAGTLFKYTIVTDKSDYVKLIKGWEYVCLGIG